MTDSKKSGRKRYKNICLFQGNKNYVQFYNAQLKDDPVDILLRISDSSSTTISPGSLWLEEDNEKFFQLLSRYSIHNVDLIAKYLNRNEEDVLSYYRMMKKTLKRWKHDKGRFHKLIRMDEFPIAYEMSKSFVKMENRQLDMLLDFEDREAAIQTPVTKEKDENCADHLVNAKHVTNFLQFHDLQLLSLYLKRSISAPLDVCYSVEDYIKLYTRKILFEIIKTKYLKSSIKSRKVLEDKSQIIKIGLNDIRSTMERLYPHNITNLEDYWELFPKRNNIENKQELKRVPEFVRKINRPLFELFEAMLGTSFQRIKKHEDGETNKKETQSQLAKTRDEQSIYCGNIINSEEDQEKLQSSEEKDEEDRLFEEAVFARESRFLNMKDLEKSRYHEHVVLTFLATANGVDLRVDDAERVSVDEDKEDDDDDDDEEEEEEPESLLDFYEKEQTSQDGVENSEFENVEVSPEAVMLQLYDFASYHK